MARKCASCGTENDDSAKFCRNCGSTGMESPSLPQMASVACPACGAPCKAQARFCLKCGARLAGESSPAAADLVMSARTAEPIAVRPPPAPQPLAPSPSPPPPPPPAEPVRTAEPAVPAPINGYREEFSVKPVAAARPSSAAYAVLGVLLLALAGVGGYFYWSLTKAKGTGPTEAPTASGAPIAPPPVAAPPVATPAPVSEEPVKAGGEAASALPPALAPDSGATPAGSFASGAPTSPTEAAPRPEPKKPTRPAAPKPKREDAAPKLAPQPPADNSSKSAEQLRREIEDELRGVTRKN